jgi:DNA-binding NarL/FixJ family response regulator
MKTILLIDDEEICSILNEEIASLGDFEIVAKHSAVSAEKYLATNRPDLIICENYLFNISTDIPIVFYTGNILAEPSENLFYKPTETEIIVKYMLSMVA